MSAIIFPVVSICLLGLIAYRFWKNEPMLRRVYWPALVCKLIGGISLGLVYRYYYQAGDTFLFFHDGKMLTEWGKENFEAYCRFLWQSDDRFPIWNSLSGHEPRSLFFSKIVSLVNFITNENYWISSCYFSFASFLSAMILARTLIRFYPAAGIAAVLSCLFIPSVVFWSAGMVKECVAMMSLCFLASVFLRVMKDDDFYSMDVLRTIFFLWILWNTKYYYAALFLIVSTTSILVKIIAGRYRHVALYKQLIVWMVVFFAPFSIAAWLRPNFRYENFFHVVVENNQVYNTLSIHNDVIHYQALQPTITSLLVNAPWALFSGLFRPFPWEAQTIFQLLVSVENILLLILLIMSVKSIARCKTIDCLIIWSAAVYIVLLCTFLALSAPNFGTLSRYRVCFLPFLFFLVSFDNLLIRRFQAIIERSFSHLAP